MEVSIEGLGLRNVSIFSTLLAVGDYNAASLCGVGVAAVTYQWSQIDGPQVITLLGMP